MDNAAGIRIRQPGSAFKGSSFGREKGDCGFQGSTGPWGGKSFPGAGKLLFRHFLTATLQWHGATILFSRSTGTRLGYFQFQPAFLTIKQISLFHITTISHADLLQWMFVVERPWKSSSSQGQVKSGVQNRMNKS